MPSLFQLPKVVGLPGSKLYFYRTGTSTPQDVYTDEDLSVAHSQPVVANGAGVFEPIYLDQTEFSYRVTYTTSADVLIYTVDDIPNNLGDGRNLTIESVTPFIELFDTDGPSNAKRVQFRQQGGDFELVIVNDAGTVEAVVFKVFRTGVNPDQMRFLCDSLTAVIGGTNYEVALKSSGTFTGTLSTGYATPPTGTVNYQKINNTVTLWINAAITGTSNGTGLEMTGLPAILRPATAKIVPTAALQNNSTDLCAGEVTITAAGALIFRIARTDGTANFVTCSASGFTNTNGKGLYAGWSITYGLD